MAKIEKTGSCMPKYGLSLIESQKQIRPILDGFWVLGLSKSTIFGRILHIWANKGKLRGCMKNRLRWKDSPKDPLSLLFYGFPLERTVEEVPPRFKLKTSTSRWVCLLGSPGSAFLRNDHVTARRPSGTVSRAPEGLFAGLDKYVPT